MANNITADVSLNIRELMRIKRISKDVEFAKELGISKQLLSKWKSRNTYDVDKIVGKFPEVSKVWLLTGEGSMLKTESATHRVESAVPMAEGKMVADDEESYQEALRKYGDSLVPEYDIEFRGGPEVQRFNLLIEYLKKERVIYTKSDLAGQLPQTTRSYITEVLNGSRTFTDKFAKKIEQTFPQITEGWLMTGEGSMLKSESAASRVESAVPMTEGKMVVDDEESYQEALRKYGDSLVPEYDIEFRGGPQGLMVESGSLLGYWVIPSAPAGSFIVSMTGRSMMPAIPSGSRLLLSPYSFDRNYPTSIPFGNLFGVVIYDEEQDAYNAHIKILRRYKGGDKDSTHWIARSINTEEFDDFDIPVHKVTHLYKVVSCISSLWGHWS